MDFIKNRREELGMTQEELGEEIGVSQSAVSMYESGDAFPSTKKLIKLTKALKCTADELLQYG